MKSSWTIAALLSSTLLVGCGDRRSDTAQNPEQNEPVPVADGVNATEQVAPPAVSTATPAASSRRDDSAVTDRAERRAAPAPEVPVWHDVTANTGTPLPLELLTAVSSETAAVETLVRARLRQAVNEDGYTVLPAGAVLTGVVTDVERAGRVQGRSRLAFRFTEVAINGGREDLRTNPITFEGEATKGEDATKVGAGAVGGAIIGGIVGGGKGAAKGAVIGSAAGAGAVLATRGREVNLASGTDITATLAAPFSTRVRER
jgi:hypothetical protein